MQIVIPLSGQGSRFQRAGYTALKDFTPITLISATPLILVVHPLLPAKTVQELVDHANAQQGKLNYALPETAARGILPWSNSVRTFA